MAPPSEPKLGQNSPSILADQETSNEKDSNGDTGSKITDKASSSEQSKSKEPSALSGFLRIFSFGSINLYLLLAVGAISAIVSGIALAMVNIVLGNFMTLLSDIDVTASFGPDYMNAVSTTALYFVYIGIVRLVGTYLYSTLFTHAAQHLVREIQRTYLRAALSQDIAYFDQETSGFISIQASSSGKLIRAGISEKLGVAIQAVSTFISAFIIAFVYQWKLTLILICLIPALILLLGGLSTWDALINVEVAKLYAQAAAYAENAIANIRTIHAFTLQPTIIEKYNGYLQEAYLQGLKRNKISGLIFGGQYFLMYSGMGLAFWQGFAMLARGEVSELGTIFVVLFSVIIAASTLMLFAPNLLAFGRAASAATELFKLIEQKSNINPFKPSGYKPNQTEGYIDIQNVGFSYPSRPGVTVLDDFTLKVPAGKMTALVGSSGSGKSTIVGLIERWYDPTAGSISLDGINLKGLNLGWLRTNIRLVQQEPVLFNMTVFENIVNGLIGTPWEDESAEAQMERVQQAAELSFAHGFIMNLPNGYNTNVGERGGLLSGGQKQRIAIARSIISDPKILLLDEATSALDPHAEGIVQQALENASKNRTTIVIAHKLATIQRADNIVVMSKGDIVEQGTHSKLLSNGGVYSGLVRAQDLSTAHSDHEGRQSGSSRHVGRTGSTDYEDHVGPATLKRLCTNDVHKLSLLQQREDYQRHPQDGLVRSVSKLVLKNKKLMPWYFLSLAVCLGGAAVYPGQALLIGRMVELLSSENMSTDANFLALMFFVIACGSLVIYFGMGWTANMISQHFNARLRKDILDSYLRQDLRFFDREENTIGALSSRLDSFPQAVVELMGINIALILVSIFSVVACAILSLVVSWKVGLVAVLVGMPPLLLAGWTRVRLETKLDLDMSNAFSQSASIASETIFAIRTVSSLAIESKVLERYTEELDSAIRRCTPVLFKMMPWYAFTQSIEHFVMALGFCVHVLMMLLRWGSKLVTEGEITLYQFIVSFMGVFFSSQGASTLFTFASSFTKANEAANYYFWLSQLEPTMEEASTGLGKKNNVGCSVYDLENIQFAYPLCPDHQVLRGVSLSVKRGQFIALVGASGCGKSTMISLLERFYDPSSGNICVDHCSLTDINPTQYRQHVSLVQQEPALFPGSVRENISMGASPDQTCTAEELEQACRAANVWDFVSSLPEGLDTPCGVGGSHFSGGQRQRIAIARALIRNPDVLLLDEATSALDTESERVVQGELMEAASRDRITVSVAHRLSTIRQADRIFVFQGGIIVEAGTHDMLVQRDGIYAEMCRAQKLDQGP